ncbi:MAG: hypothetical protein EZS28_051056 [Streblomastix strix]|uniref:Uncharacterized protein n=1 Tax=Streblomastix strix TaxID=222440 RepID=A0A5J4T5C3_9EUKA|nr:MAG: hypothetical protein EZS28_051056 [Streblomastix strix]
MADLRSIQLVTQDTQDTQDTWTFHIISPQFKFMAQMAQWQHFFTGVHGFVPSQNLSHIDIYSIRPLRQHIHTNWDRNFCPIIKMPAINL